MSPQRARMIEDMILVGLAQGTQKLYVQAVRRLTAHYPPLARSAQRGRLDYKTYRPANVQTAKITGARNHGSWNSNAATGGISALAASRHASTASRRELV